MEDVGYSRMKEILLTVTYKGAPLEIVKENVPEGFSLVTMETATEEELIAKAKTADYILASGNIKISKPVLENAKKVAMIQRLGVGLDSLDLTELEMRNIPVYVNKGVNANSVAEHTLMLMLSCLRKVTLISQNTKSGVWKKQEQGIATRELGTQTVGLIGMGNIGKRVTTLLKPFGCKVIYFDQNRLDEGQETELSIEYKTLDELFEIADVVSLHCPLTKDTQHIICEENIRKMKDGVVIINTARGALINEVDLLNGLEKGKIGFAGLDVFCEEPVTNFGLVNNESVICTPHIAGNTYDSFREMMRCAFSNIAKYDCGMKAEIEECRVK